MFKFFDFALMTVDLLLQSFYFLFVVFNLILVMLSEGSQLLLLFSPVEVKDKKTTKMYIPKTYIENADFNYTHDS